ncbi:MAG: hypothetical protein ACPG49_08555 [Chitinophagales bacterium]
MRLEYISFNTKPSFLPEVPKTIEDWKTHYQEMKGNFFDFLQKMLEEE